MIQGYEGAKQKYPDDMIFDDYVVSGFWKRDIWEEITQGMQYRLGWKHPAETFAGRSAATTTQIQGQ